MYFMIDRFIKLYNEIKKSCINLKIIFPLSDDDYVKLVNLHKLLQILYAGMVKLCNRKTNLFVAKKVFAFIISRLLEEKMYYLIELQRKLN